MIKIVHFVMPFSALLLIAGSSAGQEASPEEAVIKRMRESLRTTTVRVQTAEAELAAAQAAKVDLETKNKALETKLASLIKQTNSERAVADKSIADLKDKVVSQDGDLARLQEALAKWKQGYQEKDTVARTKEAERLALASRVILLDRKVADQQRKNDELYRIGSEVLTRYENFGLGKAFAAREPFTRITRAKMEGLVQDYRDKIQDSKIQPDDAKSGQPNKTAATKSGE